MTTIQHNAVPGGGPYAITTGPDDALWYTLVRSGQIGRLVPGGEPENHQLDLDCGPTMIASGPDGAPGTR
jgi:virginiamycin B lyase